MEHVLQQQFRQLVQRHIIDNQRLP